MRTVDLPMEELAKLLQLQLEQGGEALLTVTGVSMLPMLHNRRDSVKLSVVTEPVKKGDVILYRRENGQYVLHRIMKCLNTRELICCGDNQWEPEQVSTEQVIAVVSEFTRAGNAYSVTHKGYRLYVGIWVGLYPVRRPLICLRRGLGRIRRAVRKVLF